MAETTSTGALVEFFPQYEEVDWKAIISSAKRVDIVVHYYNRWARENFEELVTFFGRGGQLRIIMADPDHANTLSVVHDQFFPHLTTDQLIERIDQTEAVMREAFKAAASAKASLSVYYFPGALHYSAVLTDDRHLYLSVYEQFRSPVIRSSVFHLDLVKDAALENYWATNVDTFIARSSLSELV
jgi:hypothetical protein